MAEGSEGTCIDRSQDVCETQSLETIVERVEEALTNFQRNLDIASKDMSMISDRSRRIQVKLKNMEAAQAKLVGEIDNSVVPPPLIRSICSGDMDAPEWLLSLDQLSTLLAAGAQNEKQGKFVEMLRDKAIERIRNYIVASIRAFRRALVDINGLQQGHFTSKAPFYAFCFQYNKELALELQQAYVNTMRWCYSYHLEQYCKFLEQLHVQKGEIIKVEDDKRGFFSLTRTSALTVQQNFSLGLRSNENLNSIITVAQLPRLNTQHIHLERVFSSLELVLTENASSEYSFLMEYFSLSGEERTTVFNQIFEPAFSVCNHYLHDLIHASQDCLGVLICIRFTQGLALESQKKLVPVLEPHLNSMLLMLWPRFQAIMDLHSQSIHKTSLTIRTDDSSVRPHPLSQKVAELIHSLSSLCAQSREDEPVERSVARVVQEFVTTLTKLSNTISDQHHRARFLSNNYTLVSAVLSGAPGRLAAEQKKYFDELDTSTTNTST
ncbi:GARP complex subunit Vps52 [Schizosaccharomyces japonicus yFS275]|uniref:GARP complex subunit Vps52 n=1 Tax=Schizosaccharomyces japonicus (strain yFS275 / FY16936) TaxID=402676 RepID=B6K189_SCHJY|nr:GARP complex subunit Vps52 [Schizosaccharomyces japonicus yFS275]EEB07710.1 GARP complex subunit Vps52 [Schizosaccharomyces japonicus yFS275]